MARRRYRPTPRRKAALKRAQRVSAQKRRKRSGLLMRFALNKSTDVLTKGAHGRIQDYYYRKKKTDRRKRRAARKRRR